MHVSIRLAAFTLLATLPLRAGDGAPWLGAESDSGKVYPVRGVVITADRYPVSARNAGAVTYELAGVGTAPFAGTGEALSAMRNLHLMSYGGGMSLQTLSARGMGTEHTLVLWNGIPAGNMQTGITDLNLFDAAEIGAIQVVPGGASALYGSSAVGAVVNLVPRIPYSPGRSVEVSAGAGSFGGTDFSLRAEASPDSAIGFSIKAGSRRSVEDYTFGDPSAAGHRTRTNADYAGRTLSLALGWRNTGSGRIGAVLSTLSLGQGAPGPLYPGAEPSSARRADTRTLAGISVEQRPSDDILVSAAGLLDVQHERYRDPGPLFPADNYYRSSRAGFTGQVRYLASRSWLIQAGTDLALARVAGNGIDMTRTRRTAALTASVSFGVTPWKSLTAAITPSARIEGNTSFVPSFSPKVGLDLGWEGEEGHAARVHATAGTGRRNPTMNELYYSGEGGTGNPTLRDESSVSFDAGIGGFSRILGGGISWDVTWYRIRMTDRIQWTPTADPWIWSPENIGRSLSTGWEFSSDWSPLPGEVVLTFDYSTTNARRGAVTANGAISYTDRLTHIPMNKGSLGLLLARKDPAPWLALISLAVRIIHTGERYITEDNLASLPAYRTIDATLTAEFPLPGGTATVAYAPRNLANLDYQVMPGYPMPRYHHSASITYRLAY